MHVSFPKLLRDAPRRDGDAVLEQYFSDIYAMYLNKLSEYILSGQSSKNSAEKLRSLLEEIIKVKTLLHTEEIQKQATIE